MYPAHHGRVAASDDCGAVGVGEGGRIEGREAGLERCAAVGPERGRGGEVGGEIGAGSEGGVDWGGESEGVCVGVTGRGGMDCH